MLFFICICKGVFYYETFQIAHHPFLPADDAELAAAPPAPMVMVAVLSVVIDTTSSNGTTPAALKPKNDVAVAMCSGGVVDMVPFNDPPILLVVPPTPPLHVEVKPLSSMVVVPPLFPFTPANPETVPLFQAGDPSPPTGIR